MKLTETPCHLIDDRVREHRAVRMLVEAWFGESLFAALGLSGACWFILRLRVDRLDAPFNGDIDLLAGRLELDHPEELRARFEEDKRKHSNWSPELTARVLAHEGGIKWPPSTDYLVAVEAKCARAQASRDPKNSEKTIVTLKSTKTSTQKMRQMRRSIEQLSEMGLDRVALLDIIANSPAGGPGSESWFRAMSTAELSREEMHDVLQERLPSETSADYWVLSIGSIESGLEHERGALSLRNLGNASDNRRLAPVSGSHIECRKRVECSLQELLKDLPRPQCFFAVFDDCPACGKIHPPSLCELR
jgi:hypothetical protein